ncbi:MAG TPA: dihydroorotate dehydrogenase [Acidimicrobiales bacterium]|nr:dihydroorotate dehydrogenase [Acidimicrobiales bacterium]
MTARVGTCVLPNPVMTASGTAGHGTELAAYFDLSALGAVVVKSLSVTPWAGNQAPRLVPAAAGMLNSVGLQNPGIDAWLEDDLPALAKTGARVVVSVWGRTVRDYAEVGHRLATALSRATRPLAAPEGARAATPVVAIEANISCPNVEDRERMFAHSAEATKAAVGALAGTLASTGLPVWAKLSPNVTDLAAMAGAALAGGAAGLTLVNTLMGLAIDPASGRPRLGGGGGGLSGPALHPVAVRAVYECRQAFPEAAIVGVGGVGSGYDAAELISAGADAVQVGTASFVDPRAPLNVLRQLQAWCAAHGLASVSELVGRAQPGEAEVRAFPGGERAGGRAVPERASGSE